MELQDAIHFIREAVTPAEGTWGDLGAGTGLFTLALDQILQPGSTIYAADKNPHLLYRLQLERCRLVIEDLDFTRDFTLPSLDGVLMANALHYAADPLDVLKRVVEYLKPSGTFLLIEYETDRPLSPWIPYPLPFRQFETLAPRVGLSAPEVVGRVPSAYGHDHIYLATARKEVG